MNIGTGKMPSNRKTTVYLGPEDYRVFKHDTQGSVYNNIQNEPSPAGKGHDKLSHEGEEVCKGRAKIEAWFAKVWAGFTSAYEKASKLKATFNKQHTATTTPQTEKEAM